MEVGVVLSYFMVFLNHHGCAVFVGKIVSDQLSFIDFNTASGNFQTSGRPMWLLVEKPRNLALGLILLNPMWRPIVSEPLCRIGQVDEQFRADTRIAGLCSLQRVQYTARPRRFISS